MGEFRKVFKKSDIAPGTGQTIDINGTEVAIFNNNDSIKAINNACPHRGGPLSQGDVQNNEVVCPLHGWAFDLDSGACATMPAEAKTYPVKVEGDDILIEM